MGHGNVRAMALSSQQLAKARVAQPTPEQIKTSMMGGTITKLDTAQKMMVVKDKDGKEWSIYWNDSTKVEGGELKEGEMVHFKAAEQDGKMWASWLHVGKMEASKEKPKY